MAGMHGLAAFGDGLFAGLKLGSDLAETQTRMQGERDYQMWLADYRKKKEAAEAGGGKEPSVAVTTTPGAPGTETGTTTPKPAEAAAPEETGGSKMDPRNKLPVIYAAADKWNIERDVAKQVAVSEGLGTFLGDGGKSGGAFQLYTGGGLGNEYIRDRKKNPLDPANEDDTIDYALMRASQGGWGPWVGARKIGLSKWQGIGTNPNYDPSSGRTNPLATGAAPSTTSAIGDFPGVGDIKPAADMPEPPPRPPSAIAPAAPATPEPAAGEGTGAASTRSLVVPPLAPLVVSPAPAPMPPAIGSGMPQTIAPDAWGPVSPSGAGPVTPADYARLGGSGGGASAMGTDFGAGGSSPPVVPRNPYAAAARQTSALGSSVPTPSVPGNINLYNRPQVQTPGGTASVFSMSFRTPQGEVLVPQIADDGRVMSPEEARQQYFITGKHLGIFPDSKAADAYAKKLSKDQGKLYGNRPAQKESNLLY